MADGEQVCPDLMRVATVRRALHQGAIRGAFEDAKIGAGGPAVSGVDDSAVAAADIDAQGAVDAERFPGGLAEADGQISLLHLALFKGEAELLMGQGGFGKQHQTAGVFIQAVNDPGLTEVLNDLGVKMGKVGLVAILDGQQAGGFVDGQDGLILK